MTTTTVMTITDEQIAEIERDIAAQVKIKHGQCEGGVSVRGEICRECGATPKDSCRRPLPKSYAVPANITALIYRLRAAEKDAERYRWLRDYSVDADGDTVMAAKIDGEVNTISNWMFGRLLDDSIDTAMEQSK